MREIKFRAFELDVAIKRYGSYVVEDGFYMSDGISNYEKPCVRYKICENGLYFEVAPDTVGQYTGLKDKNGVEIYEGDIVTHEDFKEPSEVTFEIGCFRIHGFTIANFEAIHPISRIEIIGNIYEDKDKLK